jgi:hypothetical protein
MQAHSRGSVDVEAEWRSPTQERDFSEAAEGIRTLDLLHGKRSTSHPSAQSRAKKVGSAPRAIRLGQARFRSVWAAKASAAQTN